MVENLELKVLQFICQEIEANGVQPSLREIGCALNFSHDTARNALIALDRQGFIQRRSDKSRSIKVLKRPCEVGRAA
jgi:SOS-response transcriptional repressor LexA